MIGQKARSSFRIALLALLMASLASSLAAPVQAAQNAFDAPQVAAAVSWGEPSVTRQVEQPQGGGGGANILDIPILQTTPKIDGYCSEYTYAVQKTFSDGGGKTGTVYAMYNAGFIYVCMQAAQGTFAKRFARLYLDPQADGASYVFANKGDIALQLDFSGGTRSSYRGSGVANGWTQDTALDALWSGAAVTGTAGDSAEWKIDTGRFLINPCMLFGMAVYHHWFSAVGDDYGMPSNQWFDQPRTWQLSRIFSPACTDKAGRIAYIFRGNVASAASFYNLIVGAGYSVTLLPLGSVTTANLGIFTLIIIADDTGSLNTWGTSGSTAAQVAAIKAANKPMIGLGEGGYAYFGQLVEFIGWPNGWHGPQDSFDQSGLAPAFFTGLANPVLAYSTPMNSVGIYISRLLPGNVTPVALEIPSKSHASLIIQGCHLLWGNSGNPLVMTANGKKVFLNGLAYMNAFQCPTLPSPPSKNCIDVVKSADPAGGTAVTPGTVITYTVTVTFSNDPTCKNTAAKLLDSVPLDTTFVPGSATNGISPGADGALVWGITPSASAIIKKFQVVVSENQCSHQKTVNNRAGLIVASYPPIISNVVSHPVTCPPVGFHNNQPSYAEDEIQINPYPLVTGLPSVIKVRVTNFTSTPQTVNVAFQTSPDRFGIGLSFSSFDTRTVTLPALGSAIVATTFTPVSSGHYCIQVVVTGAGLAKPLVTQHNIDVTEDLRPGVTDDLVFKVRNPTASTATINLVVDNTCPGWVASVSPASLSGMAAGEIRTATLSVTPPSPATLGTVCHIDVQAWIGTTMIGGIRKLDVAPVHLPTGVDPYWEEPEISTVPSPLKVGQTGFACIFLQNPMSTSRTVTLDFSEADFGAGVGFTLFATKTVTLPPMSAARYCVTYTPSSGGTLHKCLLVTLKQDGFEDQRSQHNIDLVWPLPLALDKLDIPFIVHNPDLAGHSLMIKVMPIGIAPYWNPVIVTDTGGPAPSDVEADGSVRLHLKFEAAVASPASAAAAPPDYRYGDISQAQVAVYLDGELVSGFTVTLNTLHQYLPLQFKQ